MSLWVEFITASGYLSARKIRSRFQTLVAQACDKSAYRDILKMVSDTSEVKLRIRERYVVQITPAFKCSGVWPRSAAHWPLPHIPWPHPNLVVEVKTEGFDLLSKECLSLQVSFFTLLSSQNYSIVLTKKFKVFNKFLNLSKFANYC